MSSSAKSQLEQLMLNGALTEEMKNEKLKEIAAAKKAEAVADVKARKDAEKDVKNQNSAARKRTRIAQDAAKPAKTKRPRVEKTKSTYCDVTLPVATNPLVGGFSINDLIHIIN